MTNKAANAYPTESTDVSYVYSEKSDGTFVRVPIAKFANSIGVTTGDIYYASAANTFSRLPIGSSGQSLIVSAGLPAWGAAGTAKLIQRQSVSGAAQCDFTTGITTDYDMFMFLWVDVYPATNATNLWMRVSVDAGSNWLSSSYLYSDMGCTYSGAATASNSGSTNATQWIISKTVGNAVANAASGVIMFEPQSANCRIQAQTTYKGTTVNNYPFISDVGGMIATASRANGVRFMAASGNITGIISLYGFKNS